MKKHTTLYTLLFFTNLIFCQCFTTLNSGFWHVSGIKSDGTLWGRGSGNFGQLNNGTRFEELTAVPISSTADWQKLFAGSAANFAIKNNGTLWGTGANTQGVLGIGTSATSSSTFVQIGMAGNWRQISSDLHTIGVRTDGSIWGWGFNDFGQVGNGNLQDEYAPVRIGTDNDWKEVDAKGNRVSFGIKTNGTLWAWGGNINNWLGSGNFSWFVPTQHNAATDRKTVSGGWAHALMLKTNNTLWALGRDIAAGPHGPVDFPDIPLQIGTDTNWASISAGFRVSFAIKTNGTLWAWGKNDGIHGPGGGALLNAGLLGDGTTIDRPNPVQIGTDTNWATVSAGYFSVVATKTNGAVYTWGLNNQGQLGNGNLDDTVLVPTLITIPDCTLVNLSFTKKEPFSIAPNPAKDKVTINFETTTQPPTIEIYDLFGRLITSHQPTTTVGGWELSTLNFSAGVYLVVLKENNAVVAQQKLIKQ